MLDAEEVARCSSCGRRPASYFRRHSGERLCAVCLRRDLARKVKSSFSLLSRRGVGLKVAVLVDPARIVESLVLAQLLDEIEQGYGGTVIGIVSSDEEPECAYEVRRCCRDVVFAVLRGSPVEELVLRGRACCDPGVRVDVVALPGTLDDLLTAFLKELVRGGELAKPRVYARCGELELLVPLYSVPRVDVLAYALVSGMLGDLKCPGSAERPGALSRLTSRLSLEHPELLYRFMHSMMAL